MKPLDHFLKLWSLSNPEELAQTPTSNVYTVTHKNKKAVLKVYTDLGRNCESDAPYFFEACKGHGVVDLIAFNDDAVLMEHANGIVLEDWVKEGFPMTCPHGRRVTMRFSIEELHRIFRRI